MKAILLLALILATGAAFAHPMPETSPAMGDILSVDATAKDGPVVGAFEDEVTGHRPIPPLWCPIYDANNEGLLQLKAKHPQDGTMRWVVIKYKKSTENGKAIQNPIQVTAYEAPSDKSADSEYKAFVNVKLDANLNPTPSSLPPDHKQAARYYRNWGAAVKKVGCDGTASEKKKFNEFLQSNKEFLDIVASGGSAPKGEEVPSAK